MLERMFIQNTSHNVVPGKEVLFGGHYDYILYLDPCILEKLPFCGLILTGFKWFLWPKTALKWGCSYINYS